MQSFVRFDCKNIFYYVLVSIYLQMVSSSKLLNFLHVICYLLDSHWYKQAVLHQLITIVVFVVIIIKGFVHLFTYGSSIFFIIIGGGGGLGGSKAGVRFF